MTEKLFLIAQIAGRPVAIPSEAVDAVVDIDMIVPVPRSDARVRGLAALRSRVVTVIDAGVALGEPESASRRAVVTVQAGHSYAMLVEALNDVSAFTEEPLIPGMSLGVVWQPVARGLIDRDGETLLIIDLTKLLPETAQAA